MSTIAPQKSGEPPAPLNPEKLAASGALWSVGKPVLEDLLQRAYSIHLNPGETLVKAGEEYRGVVHILYDGRVQLRRANGAFNTVHIGGMIGLSGYLDEAAYSSTVTALSKATFLELRAEHLRVLEQRHADLANALHRIIVQKLREHRPERGIRSGALKNPVYGVMRTPAATCQSDGSLREAFQLMQSRRIGSLLVRDGNKGLTGILTTVGVSEAVMLHGANPHDAVTAAPLQPLYTVAPNTPLWKAEELQHRHNVKYLVVLEDGHPVGILSQTDIVRALVSEQSAFICRVRDAGDLDALAKLRGLMVEIASDLRESNRTPSLAVRKLSEAHLTLQRRCVELTLNEIVDEGEGTPPCGFAFIVMGSGGRKEMLLNPDQDNGLIIADGPQSDLPKCLAWFARFAERANANLDRIGYVLCPGNIMARNPLYRKPLSEWRQQISHIAAHPTHKAARWSNVMFDFDTLYGEDSLTVALRKSVLEELAHNRKLLRFMAEDDADGRPALGLFNRLVSTTNDGDTPKIDLKRNGLRIIDDAARIFALDAGIGACNTSDRLNALMRRGVLSRDFVATVRAAGEELMDALVGHQLEQARAGDNPDKQVPLENLSPQSKETLRIAMRAIKRLQERLQRAFDLEDF